MKIKTHFISNSSSCSFIVSMKQYPYIDFLVKYMLKERIKLLNDDIAGENKLLHKLLQDAKEKKEISAIKKGIAYIEKTKRYTISILENLKKLSEKQNSKNCPVAFKTTNFDTFIRKLPEKDFIYVATCTNIDWNLHTSEDILPIEDTEWKEIIGFNVSQDQLSASDIYEGYLDSRNIDGEEFFNISDDKLRKFKHKYLNSIEEDIGIKK